MAYASWPSAWSVAALTAKLNGVVPDVWLRYVLAHTADHPMNQVDDFLPWNCTR
jgi:hypothetical protein